MAAQCEHFSGADCRNLVDTASSHAIEELKTWRRRTTNQVNVTISHTSGRNDLSLSRHDFVPKQLTKTVKFELINEPEPTIPLKADTAASAIYLDMNIKEKEQQSAMDTNEILNNEEETIVLTNSLRSNSIDSQSLDGTAVLCLTDAGGSCDTETREPCEPPLNPFSEGEYLVYARHFVAALKKVKPSVSEKVRLIITFISVLILYFILFSVKNVKCK